MKSLAFAIILVSQLLVNSAFAGSSDVSVIVGVTKITIDNSKVPSIEVENVCIVYDTVRFVDTRNTGNNSIPKALKYHCETELLGITQDVTLYAGGGIFTNKEGDQHSYTGAIVAGAINDQVWNVSKKELSNDLELVMHTDRVVDPANPERSQSLEVTYLFKK
jgi:hypothetical protein